MLGIKGNPNVVQHWFKRKIGCHFVTLIRVFMIMRNVRSMGWPKTFHVFSQKKDQFQRLIWLVDVSLLSHSFKWDNARHDWQREVIQGNERRGREKLQVLTTEVCILDWRDPACFTPVEPIGRRPNATVSSFPPFLDYFFNTRAVSDVTNQCKVLSRGRGRSQKESESPWTLRARALIEAAISAAFWGVC